MKLAYENIVEETIKIFPEYKKTTYYHVDDLRLPSSFLFGFTRYLIDLMRDDKNSNSDTKINAAFELFKAMEWSKDSELNNLALSGVMDEMVKHDDIRERVFLLFGDKSKQHLLGCMTIVGIKDPRFN